MMDSVAARLAHVRQRILGAEQKFGRTPGSVRLLAVSKGHGIPAIREAHRLGLSDFGENHLQPALEKIPALSDLDVCWHFLGVIQSRKAGEIARHFDWVHSLSRIDIAQRLHRAKVPGKDPLNVCIQVKIGGEESKSGIDAEGLMKFIEDIRRFSGLRLRGLMTIPVRCEDFEGQRAQFRRLRRCYEAVQDSGIALDTLSMGMSGDFEAAIAEGATCIRLGTALFGPREVARA